MLLTAHSLLRTLLLLSLLALAGCAGNAPLSMMPTPVLYQHEELEPFSHVASELRSPETRVFYATNRRHRLDEPDLAYGNRVDDELHLGEAYVRIGEPESTWEQIVNLSLSSPFGNEATVYVDRVNHWDRLAHRDLPMVDWTEESHSRFTEELNRELALHVDQEIMVYVHGTKTGFENAVALAGEIDHFVGKDFVGVAFLWPAHENILHYLTGIDVRRAQHSSEALADLLKLLANKTSATRINILAWSAGGRVASKALDELRRELPETDGQTLKERYRLGSVVFAAADVAVDDFLERLPAVSALAEEVVVTISDADTALGAARRFMGGASRIGSVEAEQAELDFIRERNLDNVEIIDVSHGQERRGFDIAGHHYWYRHPWSSSDIIMLMRTDLGPEERGLQRGEVEGLWYLSPDYPERVRSAADSVLGSIWTQSD